MQEIPKLDILTENIRPEEIEWRYQSATKNGKIIVVPYITNRCVMERFDRQFGWAAWQNEIEEIKDGFLCRITVRLPDGETITKTDGASRTDIEPVKGGISDAMKRCAVQFGLGRNLYTYPKVFIECTDKYIPDWVYPLLDGLVSSINDKTFKGGDIVVFKQGQSAPKPAPVANKPITNPVQDPKVLDSIKACITLGEVNNKFKRMQAVGKETFDCYKKFFHEHATSLGFTYSDSLKGYYEPIPNNQPA